MDVHERDLRVLLNRIAHLNPESSEIGHGMLKTLLTDAKRLLAERLENA